MTTYSTKEGYLAVCNTNPSGLFYKVGIRKGDIITSVNGRSPMSITPAYFKKETVGKILNFKIIRKGVKISLPPYLNENLTVRSTESGRSL
jgi:C-terminal processing protease CtpA/Prc